MSHITGFANIFISSPYILCKQKLLSASESLNLPEVRNFPPQKRARACQHSNQVALTTYMSVHPKRRLMELTRARG